MVQGREVTFREVDGVGVVQLARPVRGVVVAAEDHQVFTAPDGDLGDERDEVVRDALGSSPMRPEGCVPTGLKPSSPAGVGAMPTSMPV